MAAIKAPAVVTSVQTCIDTMPTWLGEGRGFYFDGPLGTGKSSIAAILGMAAMKRCERVTWLPVRDVPAVRFRENDAMKRVDDRLRTTDLLILDDLGAERFRLSSAAGTALEECIRMIYDRNRSLIVSSNVSWSAFLRDYGAQAEPLMSVVTRIVQPIQIVNPQWAPPGV